MTGPAFWDRPAEPPALVAEDHVHVWRVNVNEQGAEAGISLLCGEERDRAARIVVTSARTCFIAARSALRRVLAGYTGIAPCTLRFATGPYGKLFLVDHPVSFNLSHAGDFALIAVTRSHPVGVDIEKISSARASEAIAERFFSLAEQAALAAITSDTARSEAFFHIWSRKEAVIKALGEGLSCPLATFDVTADPADARLLAFRREGILHAAWTLRALDAAPGYTAALAVIGPCPRVMCYACS